MTRFLLLAGLSALPMQAAFAQDADDTPLKEDIVVTAPRLAGSVRGDIPPDLTLDEVAIESYGASSVADLLGALSVQTRSGRGRGNAPPVVLVNGRRVSGFAEVRDLPSEAIQRVEVLPEDVALRYGFAADQRVVNFILKDNFAAITGEVEYGGTVEGGRGELELQSTLLKLSKGGRFNLSAQYDRDGAILESERGIVPQGANQTAFRTLLPTNEAVQLNAVLNRNLTADVTGTLNLRFDRAETEALLGLANTGLDPVARQVRGNSYASGVTLDGRIGAWNWTATGNLDQINSRTLTDSFTGPARDTAVSRLQTLNGEYSVTGPLAELAAGPMTLNLRSGFDRRRIRAQAVRSGIERTSLLRRDEASTRANLDIPLASRRRGVASAIGDLSINLNGGYRKLSDFGGVTAYGYGLTWSPARGLNLNASFSAIEAAPSVQQLGDPLLATPNAVLFDFTRGTSVIATLITGGNPALRAEERRDVKLGLSWTPPQAEDWTLTANYFRNRSADPITTFPALTSATEAAFAGRVVRDPTGRLTSLDQRPVNFLAARAEQMRWGLSYAKDYSPQGGRGFGPGASGGSRGEGARAEGGRTEGGRGGGRPGGFGGPGRFGGGNGKRVFISLFHTIKFRDEILTASGIPVLDLLNGDATGQNGGSSRHALELESGYFNRGFGLRLIGNWQSPTRVEGGPFGDDLRFSALGTVNLRVFFSFDQRKALLKKAPFLKGSRIAFRANNLFNAVQDIRNQAGSVPFRYQPGYLDPLGRTWEISFRKIF